MSTAGLTITEDAADAAIVRRVLDGDIEAYATLVTKYRRRLGRYALQMLGNMEDAEDVLQETFLRAYRSLARCDSPERFGGWLFRILVNRCRTAGSRRARRARIIAQPHERDDAMSLAIVQPSAERGAWREEIARALGRLPVEQREAFLLRYVEEMAYEEMSTITGARVSALKMRVMRACERLRESLREVRYAS